MNKHLHRIVFNKKRGQLMAVSEVASSQGKAGSGEGSGPVAGAPLWAAWSALKLAAAVALGAVLWVQPVLQPAFAQVIADPSAPGNQRPTVLPASNGVTQVNIQTPSAAGVSRNTYSQFDVQQQGVILNNSRGNVQTQLGGFVQGNPWLAGGAARVILNEVNSSNPSQLRGFIEVAGQRAEVIIANPAGINVNGGGFINASGVTLTTGSPVINGGNLESFRVQGGNIRFDGAGLDAASADFTSILARAVQLNAGIWAKELKVVTGANEAGYGQPGVTAIAGSGAAPVFALDVAQIGGMYAGKIFLVGTEAGLGIRNAGTLGAASGDIVLQANGWLTNTGSIQAAGNTNITANGAIDNSKLIAAQGNTTVRSTAAGAQINSGVGSVLAAGLKADGSLAASGNLAVTSAGELRLTGKTQAAGDAALAGSSLVLTDGELSGSAITLTASTGDVDASRATVKAGGLLTVNTPETLRTDGAKVSAGQLKLASKDLSNLAGQIAQTGTGAGSVNASASLVNGAGSQIVSAGDLSLAAASLSNAGKLQSGATLSATAQDIDNVFEAAISGATTTITAGASLTNRGLIDGVTTRIDAPTLNNTGSGRIFGDTLSIAATTLNNSPETLAGVTKAPVIAARERLDIGAATVNNGKDALIYSNGTGVAALNIAGALDANRQATSRALAVNNSGGTIESMGGLAVSAAQINNTNPDFAYTVQFAAGAQVKEYITAQGIYSSNDVAWELGSMTPASNGGYLYAGGQGRFLPKGAAYSDAVYAAYYSGPSPYVAEHFIDTSSGENSSSVYVQPAFGYLAGHPAWALFGVPSPVTAPPGAKPAGTTVGGGDNQVHVPPTAAELAVWEAAIAPWVALQARVEAMRASVNAVAITFDGFRDYNQSVPSATITRSAPGRLLSAGAMKLDASTSLLNDQSQIVAGGVLSVTGQALENRGRTETVNAQRTGRAFAWSNYNEGCGNVKGCSYNYNAYRDSDYSQAVPQTLTLNVHRSDSLVAPVSQAAAGGFVQTSASTVALPAAPVITLPSSSLFRINPNPAASYFVETDPNFTNLRQWLGSDYMLRTLSLDPTVTQERLGDGFYEQRLVREQVAQLTGLRFLGDFTSDEQQYRALMDAGAQQFKLRPGIALSAAQVAQLTSDVVWLVERDVTLADGSLAKALVPQVYVRPQAGDLNGNGALMAGREININLTGDLINSGTLAGRKVVSLTAENVQNLGGRIGGDAVTVAARNDLDNIGGSIVAADSLTATAGRDINIVTTTSSATDRTGGNTFSHTGVDRVAGLYVSKAGGTLVASAGRDNNIIAGVIGNSGAGGQTAISAGRDLNLGTVATSSSSDQRRGEDDFLRDSQSRDLGSQIQTAGALRLSAGNDLNARAASVQAGGDLTASAGNDVNLTAGRQTHSFGFGLTTAESDLFGSSSTKERRTADQDNAAGSSLGGNNLAIISGRDILVRGSGVISDTGTTLAAGRNIAIEAARNTNGSTYFFEEKESGLLDGGGAGITIGTREQSIEQKMQTNKAAASTVGSIGGNVTLVANDVYRQVGSDVMAPGGDVTIAAKKIDILEARETSRSEAEQKFRQSGVSLEVVSPILTAMQTAIQMAETADNTSDSRMQALAAANAGFAGKNAYDAVKAGQGTTMNGKEGQIPTGAKNPDGTAASRDATDADKAGGIDLAINIGSSSSQSNSSSQSDSARGSTITAGKNVTIAATGSGQDSNLTIQGSTVEAQRALQLLADNQVRLLAARNEASQNSTNSSKSGSIGISFGTSGLMFNASASKGNGRADGDDIHSNKQGALDAVS